MKNVYLDFVDWQQHVVFRPVESVEAELKPGRWNHLASPNHNHKPKIEIIK